MSRVRFVRTTCSALAAVAAFSLGAPGTTASAAQAAPSSGSLVFATYNVCKSECPSPAPAWDVRRARVARVLESSGADVIAVNEATNWRVAGTKEVPTANGRGTKSVAITQWEDIQGLVAPAGYVAPTKVVEGCTSCAHTARLLFKESAVSQMQFPDQISAGDSMLGDVTGMGVGGADRQMSWAYLRDDATGRGFLAISAHLDNDKSPTAEAGRVAFGRSLTSWVERMNAERGLPAGFPVVLLGDLNSYAARQPEGVQEQLTNAGWHDAWDAPKRANIDINSVNYSPTSRSGWPAKPLRNPSGVASRIDYVMYRGAGVKATDYRVVVRLDSSGRYVPDYQASDHNMVRATLTL